MEHFSAYGLGLMPRNSSGFSVDRMTTVRGAQPVHSGSITFSYGFDLPPVVAGGRQC